MNANADRYDGPFCPSCGCSVERWFYVGKSHGRSGGPPKIFVAKSRQGGARKPTDTCLECAQKASRIKTQVVHQKALARLASERKNRKGKENLREIEMEMGVDMAASDTDRTAYQVISPLQKRMKDQLHYEYKSKIDKTDNQQTFDKKRAERTALRLVAEVVNETKRLNDCLMVRDFTRIGNTLYYIHRRMGEALKAIEGVEAMAKGERAQGAAMTLKLTVERSEANRLLQQRVEKSRGSEFAHEMLYLTQDVDHEDPYDLVEALNDLTDLADEGELGGALKRAVFEAAVEVGWLRESIGPQMEWTSMTGRSRRVPGEVRLGSRWYWWNC